MNFIYKITDPQRTARKHGKEARKARNSREQAPVGISHHLKASFSTFSLHKPCRSSQPGPCGLSILNNCFLDTPSPHGSALPLYLHGMVLLPLNYFSKLPGITNCHLFIPYLPGQYVSFPRTTTLCISLLPYEVKMIQHIL